MRMFLVCMCDIFLILYLTSLSQVSPFNNSLLTVDDYNKLKEAKVQSDLDSEISKGYVVELKNRVSDLSKEKEQALKLSLSTKAEAENVMQLLNIEKEKVAKAKIELSKTLSEKEKSEKLLQQSHEKEQKILEIVKKSKIEAETAKENEQKVLKITEELRAEARKSEQFVLKIVEEAKLKTEKTKKNDEELRKLIKDAQAKAEESRKKEEAARKIAEEERRIAKESQLKAEEARKNEDAANKIAEEERLIAEIARKNEAIAIKSAETSENKKRLALRNEQIARDAEASAKRVASVAQRETVEAKTKIKNIIQTSDKAYTENVLDKLTQFNISSDYKSRLESTRKRDVTIQGLPVKIGDEYVIFVTLDIVGLNPTSEPGHYASFNLNVNNRPVTKLYIKPGDMKIAALVLAGDDIKHCLPVDKSEGLSSFMPVLLSVRSKMKLGVMDRIRGIDKDYFVFARDFLKMITENELYFDNEGFRGTGNYAEYIIKGDQVVDLEGNYIGFAYKKNTILRIENLEGWRGFSTDDI